jgi:hypothetical protein
VGQHVGPGDAATLAAALDLVGIELVLGDQPADHR